MPRLFTRDSCIVAAVLAIGAGMAINKGEYQPLALALIALLALPLLILACVAPQGSPPTRLWQAAVAAGAALVMVTFGVSVAAVSGAVAVVAMALILSRQPRLPWLLLLAVVWLLTMVVVTGFEWARADIDVFWVVQNPASWLIHGHDPYGPIAIVTRSLNQPTQWIKEPALYGPGIYVLAAPFALLGDTRVGSVVMVAVVLMCLHRLARRSGAAAGWIIALVVAVPSLMLMVSVGWVDLLSGACFIAWFTLRDGHPRWAALLLGVCLVGKPLCAVALVPLFLADRSIWRQVAAALGVGLVICAVFFAWSPHAFLSDAIGFQLRQPTFTAALGLNALLLHLHIAPTPGWFGVVIGLAVLGLMIRHRPRTTAEAFLGGALLLLVLLLVGRQAFYDYYFDVLLLLYMALATRVGDALPDGARAASLTAPGTAVAQPASGGA